MIRTVNTHTVNFDASPHLIHGWGYRLFVTLLIVGFVLVIGLSVSIGSVSIPLTQVWQVVGAHLAAPFTGGEPVIAGIDPSINQIVWEFRMPRALLGVMVGAALAIAGAVMQAAIRNPLADPYILGTVSGASVGAVFVILSGAVAVTSLSVTSGAFVGAMISLLLVFLLGRRGGTFAPMRLVLAGVALGYLLSSITSFMQMQARPNELRAVLYWLLGSVAGAEWEDLYLIGMVVIVLTGWLLLQSRALNVLVMGEESAYALGIDVNRFRLRLLIVAALLTSVVVAVSGGIGFIGLMIPHTARLLVGPDHRRLMLVTFLLGGILLILFDIAARTIIAPAEMPLGIITGAVGAPFFIFIMQRTQRTGGMG